MKFENFSIRLLSADDLPEYFKLLERNRPRLEDFLAETVSKTQALEDTGIFIAGLLKKYERKAYYPFLIIDDNNNSIIGSLSAKNIDWKIPKAELGCYIDEAYAGKGIITKALLIFTAFCFKNYGFKKLFLRTHQSNYPARKVAERCGFEMEGIIRRDYKTTAGELIDLIYYGKLSDS